MLKFCKLLILLLAACMLTVACSKPKSTQNNHIAVIGVNQALSVHALYAEYKNTEQIVENLEASKVQQQELAKKQLLGLNEIVDKGLGNRDKFNQALMLAKVTELEALAKMELIEVQAAVKKELKASFDKKEQEIRNSYKVPIFNIRANLSIVRLKAEEREKLLDELATLELEQAKRLNALEQEKLAIVKARTKDQEAAIIKRLSDTATGTYQQMLTGSNEQEAVLDQKMNKLAEELQKTIFNLQQEIDNQKNKQEMIYQKMYQDLESATAKIAQEKGYGIVLRDVKLNLQAVDITPEVKAELVKYNSK